MENSNMDRGSVYSIDLNTVSDWDAFNNLMNDIHVAQETYAEEEAARLGIELDVARDIIYLRGRSRWTFEKEEKLIELSKQGIRPNIMEWDGEAVPARTGT